MPKRLSEEGLASRDLVPRAEISVEVWLYLHGQFERDMDYRPSVTDGFADCREEDCWRLSVAVQLSEHGGAGAQEAEIRGYRRATGIVVCTHRLEHEKQERSE